MENFTEKYWVIRIRIQTYFVQIPHITICYKFIDNKKKWEYILGQEDQIDDSLFLCQTERS